MPRPRHAVLAATLAVSGAWCAGPDGGAVAGEPAPLTVLAAASLSDVLPRVAAARGPGAPPVRFSFDATSRLARQIEAGAPADVFVSADREWMDHLAARDLVEPKSITDLAGNRLVVVVRAGGAFDPRDAAALVGPTLARLALAGEAVPAGRYARAALASGGAWDAVRARVVDSDNVRGAMAWVARGEATAAIVYGSDARVEPRVRVAFAFPPSSHPPIVYPGAVVRGSARASEASVFLALCASKEARAILDAAGFIPPPARAASVK